MDNKQPYRIKTISEYHKLQGFPKPEHPLISVVNVEDLQQRKEVNLVLDFYSIAIKRNLPGKIKYGQLEYDFDEGIMFFIAPNQVYSPAEVGESSSKPSGWMLLVHPDFFWNTPLAKTIRQYEFFDYSTNEALFLSEKEENVLDSIIQNIRHEYHSNIDKYSKSIIVSHIETLLNYSERFYNRQFITREKGHHQILERLENYLTQYFNSEELILKGLPSVQSVADALNISPSYLGNLLRVLTGQNTQQHIHNKVIEKGKEKLSTTTLTVSEIAYDLGFEHLQSFSRLFKAKTNYTPKEFRESFN